MSSLLSKLNQIRLDASQKATDRKTNTKSPIHSRIEQQAIQARIDSELGSTYSLWWRLAIATGYRTTDVCEIKFSDIDFSTGTVAITINKQTRAATARAANRVLKEWHFKLKQKAHQAGDHKLYLDIDISGYKQIEQFLTDEDMRQLEVDLTEAVNNAPVKRDSKKLPKKLLDEIKKRQEMNIWDDYVFSRHLAGSNRARNCDGNITRQAVWKALKPIFDWFASKVNGEIKLSAYSSRKTYAINLMNQAVSMGKDGLSIVCDSLGHSSISQTKKYLMLSSEAQKIQAQMVG